METSSRVKPPVWFWVLSVLALLWNLVGVMAYIIDVSLTAEDLEKLPEAERLLRESMPAWVTAAFAVAVWGGFLGCVALLLRKKWARPVLLLSLIAIIVQVGYSFFMSNSFEVYGPSSVIMPMAVLIIGIMLVVFARIAHHRLWIF